MADLRSRRLQEILETLAGWRGADGDRAVRLSDLDQSLGTVRNETVKRIGSVQTQIGGDLTAVQQAAAQAEAKADQALTDIGVEVDARLALADELRNNYLDADGTTAAISLAATTLKAEIENPAGDSLGATLDTFYLTAVETNAAISAASLTLEATFAGALYAITDPLLAQLGADGWTRAAPAQGMFSRVDNEQHPSGKTWAFDVALGQVDGLTTDSDAAQWKGAEDADAYVVEVEFTLTSGSLDGAGIEVLWITDAAQSYAARASLADALMGSFALNAPMRAQVVLTRPDGYAGTIDRNVLTVWANAAALGDAAKAIRFHMVAIRPATAEERGEGAVGAKLSATLEQDYLTSADTFTAIASASDSLKAEIEDPNGDSLGATVDQQASAIAQIDGYLAATYSFAVRAGSGGARLDLVATNDPGGGTSLARIEAEFIILSGTVTAPLLAVDSVLARHARIGDTSNMVPDAEMSDPANWTFSWASGAGGLAPASSTESAVNVVLHAGSTGHAANGFAGAALSRLFEVKAGRALAVGLTMRCWSTATGAFQAYIRWYDASKTALTTNTESTVAAISLNGANNSSERTISAVVTPPAGACYASWRFRREADANGNCVGYTYWYSPWAMRAVDSAIITPSGIKPPDIDTAALAASSAFFNVLAAQTGFIDSLTSKSAFIDNLEVGTTLTIAGQAVGYNELASGAAHVAYQNTNTTVRDITSQRVLHSFTAQHDGFIRFRFEIRMYNNTFNASESVVVRLKLQGTTRSSKTVYFDEGQDIVLVDDFIFVGGGSTVEFTAEMAVGAGFIDYSKVISIITQRA